MANRAPRPVAASATASSTSKRGGGARIAGSKTQSPLDVILDQRIDATINGKSRVLTYEDTHDQRTLQRAFKLHPASVRKVLKWIEEREEIRLRSNPIRTPFPQFKFECRNPQPIDDAAVLLGIARQVPEVTRTNGSRYFQLHNWAIETALRRHKKGRLSASAIKDLKEHAVDPDNLDLSGSTPDER